MKTLSQLKEDFWPIGCVWLRYFDVYRKNWIYGLVTTFVEPLLYLLSFGYGLGTMIGSVEENGISVTYRQFVFAGFVAQSCLFQGFFEAAYGSFVRMYYQKIFKAMASTPITLSEVLWGELLWDATKGTLSATAILTLGSISGDLSPIGSLFAIPLCFLGALLFASLGLWMAALSQTIEQISYPQYLLVFPMFLFCGVYFPLETLPQNLQLLASFLPLTALLSLIRCLTLDFPFQIQALAVFIFWLVFMIFMSRDTMSRRLVK
ncbi:MAG: ABC transporter [Deltaproteobacteria bacterium]|nr:ABC transporter [Deltaproteobacteria bacterium]MBM4317977.1 ABC transporter [Deltaproteobacteria bacterium]